MAVIKGNRASTLIKDAIVLDLGDVSREAARIKAAAEARAQQIEAEARERAEELTRNASTDGFEQGHAAGLQKGLEDGRTAAQEELEKQINEMIDKTQAQVYDELRPQLETLHDLWLNAARRWEAHCVQVEHESRHAVLELTLRLAEKITHRQIKLDQTVVVDQVAEALAHVLGAADAVVHVNPHDTELIENAIPSLLKQLHGLKKVDVEADESVSRGGCVVTYTNGRVDATLETQLQRVVELLLPEPPAPRTAAVVSTQEQEPTEQSDERCDVDTPASADEADSSDGPDGIEHESDT